jgi:hypothetical protein
MFCVLQECTNLETTHYFRSGRQQVILNNLFESGLNQEQFRSCRGNNCFTTSGPKNVNESLVMVSDESLWSEVVKLLAVTDCLCFLTLT